MLTASFDEDDLHQVVSRPIRSYILVLEDRIATMVSSIETSLVTVHSQSREFELMSYNSYYPVSPARRVAYLLDMPRQPYESACGLALVVSFLRIDSLRAMSAQVTWGTWFGLVIGTHPVFSCLVRIWFNLRWS